MSRRFERKVTRRRRGERGPGVIRGMKMTTLEEAAELASECECPVSFSIGGSSAVIVQTHRHGCPTLRRRYSR